MALAESSSMPTDLMRVADALDEGFRAELIRGDIVVSPPAVHRHQLFVARIIVALQRCLPADLVAIPDVGLVIGDDLVIPDVVVLPIEVAESENVWTDVSDVDIPLVVEVWSPSTGHRDRGAKREIYAQAIDRYWLADPATDAVVELDADGTEQPPSWPDGFTLG